MRVNARRWPPATDIFFLRTMHFLRRHTAPLLRRQQVRTVYARPSIGARLREATRNARADARINRGRLVRERDVMIDNTISSSV